MKIIPLFLLLLLSAYHSLAQDSAGVKDTLPFVSGYADVYYKYNFNGNATDNKTSFTNSQNSFELGMISVKLQHTFGKVSFVGNVAFGKRADEFSYNDEKTSVAIEQLYMSYAPAAWIKLSAGSFATHIGYELADANLNRNYSMSYMFSYGPFFHTGLKADLNAGASTWMIGVFNPTDYKYAPPGGKKYLGAQWGFSPSGSPFASYLNYLGGTDTAGVRNDQLDLVMTYKISDRLSIAYDGTVSRDKIKHVSASRWWGSALYLNGDLSSRLGMTLRTEYFNDRDGLKVFTDSGVFPRGGDIWAYTLSADYKIGALMLIPEFRLDHASGRLFTHKNGNGANTSPNVLLAAIYTF